MPDNNPKISFITTTGVNVGDEFIREGICSFLDEIFPNWTPYYINKHDRTTLYRHIYDEPASIGDKIVNADIVIQAGAPVYWKLGNSTSYNVEWADELWFKRIFRLGPEKPILNIAAGACQPYPDFAKTFLDDPACVDFALNAARACRWTSVRDPLASQILYALNIEHEPLPCSAFHAARRVPPIKPEENLVGVNLMPLGGHFRLREDVSESIWLSVVTKVLAEIRKDHRVLFIAHDHQEKKFMERLLESGEEIFHSSDYRMYMKNYASCSYVLANRVHGGVCAAGFGRPAIIVGNDTRLQIADFIGLPSLYVGSVTSEELIELFHKAVSCRRLEEERLLTLREESAARYRYSICNALGMNGNNVGLSNKYRVSPISHKQEPLRLSSIEDVQSSSFADFMSTMNQFSRRYGFTQYSASKECWSYPWLWFNAITGRDWNKLSVLDLGSEISPMPWFLASVGARVTLIECDPQWIQKWESLKKSSGLDVDWRIVKDEVLPFEENSFDIVTSFSVIEHQGDKRRAVEEVLRVLKPGGTFALSFDICEPGMGMTFPQWNGRALTMKEFEEVVWRNSGFVNNPEPEWNIEDIPEFIEWHLKSADHHNYTVGAAVLRKRFFDATAVRKILLPRFDTHGDIVLLEGFIQTVLDKFPNAEVTIFVREGYDQLAPLFPERLKWRTQPYNPWVRYTEDELKGIVNVIGGVAQERWDLALFTTYNRTFLEDLLASRLNGTKMAIGVLPNFRRWQEQVFAKLEWKHPQYDFIVSVSELSHETEKYQTFCSTLFDKSCEVPVPQLAVPPSVSTQANNILERLGLEPNRFVACLPAGTQNVEIKKWPEERYAEVLVWLYREHGIVPLLVGHESESDILEKVAVFMKTRNVEPQIWIGKTGEFALLGGILKNARMYLGNDAGPMHLAAALGVPTLAIFGGGTWPRFLPASKNSIAVAAIMPCYYCMWDCIFGNAPCLSFLTVEDVKNSIIKLLEGQMTEKLVNVASSICPTAIEFADKAAAKIRNLRNESDRQQEIIEALTESLAENNELHSKVVEAVKGSLSWRITSPLRKAMDILKKL